ncbi:hypothetical protein JY96_21560 [Aquabacterium sp. NJ1]|uniref:hypothetical protein n=1 Tax=Aquabacterium sp. NJ1 TaxID=1538295 RepID=UPI00052CD57B|nr:hypothetical protein [Aquabacterium sp. NJ1]KGM38750.1 hypothetical protein JY96_21560 [Aquabacterium sp. NJ1]
MSTTTITVEAPVCTPYGKAKILIGRYQQGGSIAIQLITLKDEILDEPLATFSTNIAGARTGIDEFCVKSWSENEPLVEPMFDTGLFERTGRSSRNGMVSAEVWRIKSPSLVPPPVIDETMTLAKLAMSRLHIVPLEKLPDVLKGLSAQHRMWLNDTLLNDDESTDEELKDHLTKSCGMPEDVVTAALTFRDQALADPLFHLFDPTAL